MGRKKKFIDKKKSATFQLLARDSSDPNYDDSPGADRVFVRVDNNQYSIDSFASDENASSCPDDPNSIFADAPSDDDVGGDFGRASGSKPPSALPEHVRREILELGFPDDGYNYLTHLREIKNTGGGSAFYHNSKAKLDQLPLDVKAYDASRVRISEVNENPNEKSIYSVASKSVGVRLQKAIDPEVSALLDDDNLSRFDSDVEDLEEDFIVQANLPEEGESVVTHKELNVEGSEGTPKELNQSVSRGRQENVAEFVGADGVGNHKLETGDYYVDEKLRVRRPLDEQFDLLELQEYGSNSDDDYDGSIAEEDEPLAHKLNNALKDHVMDNLEHDDKYKVPADLLHDNERPNDTETLDSTADLIRRCVEYAEKYENEDEEEKVVVLDESSDESEVWDCETIVSTYSNLDNHPGKIEAPGITRKKKLAETVSGAFSATSPVISLRGKEKLPVDFLPYNRKAAMEKVKGVDSLKTEQQKRKQHGQETKEEKKERKAALKEERREARRVKKEMKELYKCEGQRAQKVAAISGPSSIHLM
ncbi:hypothetical protein L1049_026336 [Liquidambar formosana]|uniref:Protein LTV1 homolog n=1 Tax=Liquidambar formosana TaxID=63359 RepID=A0AAP0ND62_LIQFO